MLAPAHPLRILLLGEPDEMSVSEFASKVGGWLRLIPQDSSEPRGAGPSALRRR